MAVITLGGFAVAQPRNLAVVGAQVGFQAFSVAVSATLGDLYPAAGVVNTIDSFDSGSGDSQAIGETLGRHRRHLAPRARFRVGASAHGRARWPDDEAGDGDD